MKKTTIILCAFFLFLAWHQQVQSAPKPRIGICLGGGGALGFAHVGALQALEDNGIFPDEIAGASMGAIIGCMYADGYTPQQMLEIIQLDKMYSTRKLLTWIPALKKTGMSNHNTLRNVLKEHIPHNSFEGLKKKMYVCVVNLDKGSYEIISTGKKLDMWVAASASIPWVFESILHQGIHYVDGGVLNNMPAQALKTTCDVIIGIDVVPYKFQKTGLDFSLDILAHTVRTILSGNSEAGRSECDYVIESKAIEKWHEASFGQYHDIYNYGYKAVEDYIAKNKDILRYAKEQNSL